MGVVFLIDLMKKSASLFLSLFCFISSFAQQVRPASAVQIYHELNQLKHLTNVLYLAAHPDDENTRMLAWLVNDQHIPTAYLSLTRGDGGQNILGPHLGAGLGLIRTNELLAARKLDGGAAQYFTRAVDFGYSKTAEETFKHWDKDVLTGDVVWTIRQFRPDVIICRFPPNEKAGHGQHAASAILAHEAFKVAGNANSYKDQLTYLKPWKPERIFFNAYRFGSRNTTSEDQFKVEVGQYNSLLGMGYGELAGISRSIHRSQGAGTRSVAGVQTEYLDLVDGTAVTKSLFDGIDITWGRIGRADIGKQIETIIASYDFSHPEKSLPALLDLYKQIKQVKDNDWKAQKIADVKQLILHTAGFMAEIYTDKPEVMRGEQMEFTMNFIARSGDVKVRLQDIKCLETDTTCHLYLPNDELVTFVRKQSIPATAPYSEPYWLATTQTDDAHYPIPDAQLRGQAQAPAALSANLRVLVGDETILVDVPLSYKVLNPTRGDVVEPLRVVPKITVEFGREKIFPNSDGGLDLDVVIKSKVPTKNLSVIIDGRGISDTIKGIDIVEPSEVAIAAMVPAEKVDVSKGSFKLSAKVIADKVVYDKQQHTINYDHLPTLQYYTTPQVQVVPLNWQSKNISVAYVEGAGDDVPAALSFAGVNVSVIPAEGIPYANLSDYDAVIVGIRALNVKEDADRWMETLLNYAQQGGTLVMQYNTAHRLKTDKIGPYPIKLSRDRVTEEDAKVTILNDTHRLLTYPNMITQADFDGWVQERGLYFATEWDKRYTPLFSMHDTGEEPLKGSTLYTKYGNGHYVYTSLSFFRQLPAGNVGAIRLLLNFISIGK